MIPRLPQVYQRPDIDSPFLLRKVEIHAVSQILAEDGDLMVAGVSGSGRRSLIQLAAQRVRAKVMEIDCLRATTSSQFLTLLAEGLLEVFPDELGLIEKNCLNFPLTIETNSTQSPRLTWQVNQKEEWSIFQALLAFPQMLAEQLDCRVVFVFQNFPHIRSWDRSGQWEAYLRQEVQQQSRINYVILATVPEIWANDSNLKVMSLAPLQREELQAWVIDVMAAKNLDFQQDALELFLDSAQGHIGDAIALARRLWLEYRVEALGIEDWDNHLSLEKNVNSYALPTNFSKNLIQFHQVHRATLALIQDLSQTFESLLLLLPPIQARVLESLASDPTDSPHAKEYVHKHQLSKGGGLQGALLGLEQKGLIYGAKLGYRVALPLLALWLKQRLA
ncbi:MAG: hypothetical protein DCF12_12470 [Snowella sp.]|jgi:hypothetical protein|nr:MAG: hypothetical protein DCF12_12470 [Snowella sp.]